jgi:hypothetical protein
MEEATLSQGNAVLNLILQRNMSLRRLQGLLSSGLLTGLLDANLETVDHDARWKILWLLGHRSRAIELAKQLHLIGEDARKTGTCSVCRRKLPLISNPWNPRNEGSDSQENYLVSPHGREAVGCAGNYDPPEQLT